MFSIDYSAPPAATHCLPPPLATRALAHAPARDQTVHHVRIGFGEIHGEFWRIALQHQHGTIGRIGGCAAQYQLAALVCGSGVQLVCLANWHADSDVVVDHVVHQRTVRDGRRDASRWMRLQARAANGLSARRAVD